MTELHRESRQTEPHNSEAVHGKSSMLWLWLALVLLFAYPLSIGPVVKIYGGRPVPNALKNFYAPLGMVYQHNFAARRALDWYARLWGVHF